jgi:rsbT co-antagonist protein RsbR
MEGDLEAGHGDLAGALSALEEVVGSVGRGRLDVAVQIDFSEDHPIGALATALNEMIDSLRTSRAERQSQEAELETRLRTIEDQRAAIAELSSPVIEVWQGVLTLPVVGAVDTERATMMTSGLLDQVLRARAKLVIIDLTGMHGASAEICDHLVRMARCVRLLGSECAVSGMRADVARTLAELGSDIGELHSFPTLRAALAHHVQAGFGRGLRKRGSND